MAELVGRTEELRALGARLAASPVTLVLGRAGIGKTATVRHVVRGRRAIEIGVRPGDDRRQVLGAVGRALAGRVVVPASLGDVEALGEAIARAAERAEATIVVDDLHHLSPREIRAIVEEVTAVARRSRWVFLARALPPEVRKRHARVAIELDDLDPRSLRRLARSIAPNVKPREIGALVEAAQGSPWLLRRCLTTRAGGPPDAREIAAALPKRAAPLLRLLAALHLPIDAATARALGGPLPRGPEVELGRDRVRAHDALRDALARDPLDADLPRRLDVAASELGDAAASLEAARLHLEAGDAAASAEILERTFDAIVDAGLAPRLHVLLRDTTDAPLSEIRLRAAIVLGAGLPLDEVLADPRPQTPGAHTAYAEGLLLAGRPLEARALLEKGARTRRDEILLARTLLTMGALDEAQALVGSFGGTEDVRVTALAARIAAARGDHAKATALADELGALAATLPSSLRRMVQNTRITVYSSAGNLKQVRGAARALYGTPSAGMSLIEEQGGIATLALVEIEGANIEEGRRLLGMLAADARGVRFFRRMNTIRIHMIEGDFAAASAEADAVLAEAEVERNLEHERWGRVAWSMLRLLLASDVRAPHVVRDEVVTGSDAQASFLRAFRRIRALRVGASIADDASANDAGDAIDARIFALLAEATAELFRSAWDDVERSARRAVALAEEHGYVAHAFEARLLLFDALFVAQRHAPARSIAGELDAIARRVGSRRFALEAELANALFAARPPIRALERIAEGIAIAPAAARRARRLLGLADDCDRLDARVVAAATWSDWVRSPRGGAGPSWGIDLDEQRIWFPDGRTRALAPRALHGSIVRALVDAKGACTKEELAKAVWGVRDYHPLRDDKRIQVAIMRLRRAVEDGKRASRIASTPDGYALGPDPMRLVERTRK